MKKKCMDQRTASSCSKVQTANTPRISPSSASANTTTAPANSGAIGYTVREWAASLRIGLSTAWELVWSGKVGHYKIGRRVLIGHGHAEEFKRKNECPAFDALASAKATAASLLAK